LWRRQVQRVGIQVKPGLIELLDFVDSQRLPAAVATSSEKEYADITLLTAGVLDRFKLSLPVTASIAASPSPTSTSKPPDSSE
jgi:beta-phosphoglucomutase-like phosphatase (HAD superfamily)